jgi:Ca-activated chloride channel homolog
MTFLSPYFLLLLVLIPLMGIIMLWRASVRAAALRRVGDAELVQRLLSRISPFRRRIRALLWLVALASLILALARPTWSSELQRVDKAGIAIMIVLDVSRSMDAQDIAPSRLERAKLDLRDFIGQIQGNDVGIVLFAGEARPYLPLTFDTETAQVFLQAATSDRLSPQGTALEMGLREAILRLDASGSEQRMILIVSDGENHAGDPLAVAQEAASEGITIHTIGYGTVEGAPVPLFDKTGQIIDYKRDANNELISTKRDDSLLRRVAEAGQGMSIMMDSGASLQPILEAVKALTPGTLGEEFTTRPLEQFSLFAALALLALVGEIVLPETRREAA